MNPNHIFLVTLLTYFAFNSITLYGIDYLNRKLILERKTKGRRTASKDNAPSPTKALREALKFTRRDKRKIPVKKGLVFIANGFRKIAFKKPVEYKGETSPVSLSYRAMYYLILSLGVLPLFLVYTEKWVFAFTAVAFPWVSILFSYFTSKKPIAHRKRLVQRMFEIASAKLGLRGEPEEKVQITSWSDDTTPTEVKIEIPTTFEQSGEEGFLLLFNQVFGNTNAWVADNNPEKKQLGWDYENGVLTLKVSPPIPTGAKWSEWYAIGEPFAWSFFPLGLTNEGGYEVPNPETGEVEHIVGFDIAGLQSKRAKELGYPVDEAMVTTAPMVLFAGGTGGGKAMDLDTLVLRKKAV